MDTELTKDRDMLEKDLLELMTAVEPESNRLAMTALYEFVKAELRLQRG